MKPLQKLAIPVTLFLAGFIISTITRSHSSEQGPQMGPLDYVSLDELSDEEKSLALGSTNLIKELDEEEGGPLARSQNSTSPETIQVQRVERKTEIIVEELVDGFNIQEKIDGIRSLAVRLQDRECELESQFYNYCNAKEQESAFQRLQIMCLGLELESVESQNQRLETHVAECREAMEKISSMREEIKSISRKVKKLLKRNRTYMSTLRQREAKILKANEEFIWATKEIREVAEELHKERKLIHQKMHSRASVDPSTPMDNVQWMTMGSAETGPNNELLAQMEQIRDQWSAKIEELIHLGWVKASSRREILGDRDVAAKPSQEVRDDLVMELPAEAKVRNCTIEFYDSEGPSMADDRRGEARTDVAVRKRHAGFKVPGLLHKLRGWAKGKGTCKQEEESSLETRSIPSGDGEDHVKKNSC